MSVLSFAIVALITGLFALWFGYIGYNKNRKSFLHKIFGLMNLTVAFWSISYFFWLISDNYNEAYFWVGSLSLGANFIPIIYLHWIISLFNLNKKYARVIRIGYIITILFSFFVYSPLYFKDLRSVYDFIYWPTAGPLYIFYILILYIGFPSFGLMLLFRLYKSSTGKIRGQIQYWRIFKFSFMV